jgi:hypothetical protein
MKYSGFVHSEGVVAGSAVVAIEVFSHVHSSRALGALLMVALNIAALVH